MPGDARDKYLIYLDQQINNARAKENEYREESLKSQSNATAAMMQRISLEDAREYYKEWIKSGRDEVLQSD